MISLDKCTGSCNILSPKICVPKIKKEMSLKVFNMITNKNEAKAIAKYISYDCKWKHVVHHVIQIRHGLVELVKVNFKNYRKGKKYYSWNSIFFTCEYSTITQRL